MPTIPDTSDSLRISKSGWIPDALGAANGLNQQVTTCAAAPPLMSDARESPTIRTLCLSPQAIISIAWANMAGSGLATPTSSEIMSS